MARFRKEPVKKEAARIAAQRKVERKIAIFRMYFRDGKSQTTIATHMGFSQAYVWRLLREIKQEAQEAYLLPREEAITEELLILEERERMLIEAWDQSKEPTEQITQMGKPGPDGKVVVEKSVRTRITKPPDVKAVNGLIRVSQQRIKLLGLEPEKKIEQPPAAQSPFDRLPDELKIQVFRETLDAIIARGDENAVEGAVSDSEDRNSLSVPTPSSVAVVWDAANHQCSTGAPKSDALETTRASRCDFLSVGVVQSDPPDIEYRYRVICRSGYGKGRRPRIICQRVRCSHPDNVWTVEKQFQIANPPRSKRSTPLSTPTETRGDL